MRIEVKLLVTSSGGYLMGEGMKEPSETLKILYLLICVGVPRVYSFVKIQWVAFLGLVYLPQFKKPKYTQNENCKI